MGKATSPWAILPSALIVAMSLAGCGGNAASGDGDGNDLPALDADKGAISGIVIDDRYRPVPEALVLLTPVGLTAETDSEGQFGFTNLAPGSYVIQVQAEAHEAAPITVDVVTGQYTDVEAEARRVFSDDGVIISLQASIFIPCAVASPRIVVTANCLADVSGDSYRTGFTTRFNKTTTTWLVGEVRFNKADNYMFVLRPTDSSSVGDAYNYTIIHMGDYGRAVLSAQNKTYQQNSWNPGKDMQATVFFSGQTDGITGPPICPGPPAPPDTCVEGDEQDGFGTGASFAIKATMILTAFVGPPTVDPTTYAVLKPTE